MKSLRHKDRRPTHPGAVLREIILPELRVTQTEFAQKLEVSRRTVSELIHERRPVTSDMAVRLARLVGGTAGTWLKMQQAVDLWDVERTSNARYASIKRLRGAGKRKAG